MSEAAATALAAAVGSALARDAVMLEDVTHDALDYDVFLAHRAVTRIHGTALVGGERIPWSMIEKTTEGPHLAIPYLTDNGEREFQAYASGLLDDLAPAVRAPRVYGSAVEDDGRTVLWLEEITHDGTRPLDAATILEAAHDLGGLAGRWIGRELVEPWLFTGWISRHSQPESAQRGLATLRRRHPAAVYRLGDRLERTERLLLAQPRVAWVLDSLPHTLCHHDAVGANVFRSRGTTVLIDWESVGPGPIGADLASLLFSSVRRGDASAGVVVPLLKDAFDAYVDGIHEESPGLDAEVVRRGLDAANALRWKLAVDVADGLERGEVPRRGSLPDEPPEQALDELVLLVDVLLDSAERTLQP